MKNFDSLPKIFGGGVLFRKEERHWFACSSETLKDWGSEVD